jgi:hypothetical protein
MATTKQRVTLWIDPYVMRELKFLGVEYDQPVGNVIEALVKFSKKGDLINDETFQRRFDNLLKMAFANAGRRGARRRRRVTSSRA